MIIAKRWTKGMDELRFENVGLSTLMSSKIIFAPSMKGGLAVSGDDSCPKVIGDKTTVEACVVVRSFTAQANLILQAKRRHWGIENKLYWVLDVAFAEDLCRVWQGFAAENLAVIRHLVLNLLCQDKKSKLGIENRRLRCGWDVCYRTQILNGIT